MFDSLIGKTVYYNVRTKRLVAVLEKDDREARIATVKDGAAGRPRPVRASLFHDTYLASDGQPHGYGYVPVDALPEDHPHAVKAPTTDRSSMQADLMDNLEELDDAQLALVILEQQKIKSIAEELVNRAKAVAKARRNGGLGIDIQDGIALVYTSGEKFDAGFARRNLAPEDYQRILLAKPDATLARTLFKNEPEKLKACLKDNGSTLTVREATDEDKARFASSAPKGDEDFTIEV